MLRSSAKATLIELETEFDRAREDLVRALEDRFADDHDSSADDLANILASTFDRIMRRAWRRAKEALD
jgi:hypothetical protein